jgi:hypothetical protein
MENNYAVAIARLENQSISERTKERYHSTNFHFVVYLSEKYPNTLHPDLIPQINEVKTRGLSERVQEKELRSLIQGNWLIPLNSATHERCPICLDQLSYDIVARYMYEKKHADGSYYNASMYEGIRSSIMYLFKVCNVSPPDDFQKLNRLLKALKRAIVSHKVAHGRSLEEGKRVMSLSCLRLLCQIFAGSSNDEYFFAWPFILLEWNLMARSDNIVNLHVNDLSWTDDSLNAKMKKSKTDQEGNNAKVAHHMYFNSADPFLNIGIALGIYFFLNGTLITNPNSLIFPANNQYHRYSDILSKVVAKNASKFAQVGIAPGDIGTHSARKGAASLAASGCTIAPSMASICNRAGWSLGGTRDKYIKYENAQDQFLGRVLCGLNVLGPEFSTSPPFFDVTADELMDIDLKLREVIPNGHTMSASTYEVLRMCYASIVFHYDWLNDVLHPSHKFRSHPVFTCIDSVSCVL